MNQKKDRPYVTVHGKSQAALNYKNGEERFNFLPKDDCCPVCGCNDFAYCAFNMRDGRITVQWICLNCGRENMMKKVRFVSDEQPAVEELNRQILAAYILDRPSMKAPIEHASISAKIYGTTLTVRFSYGAGGLLFAKLLSKKKSELMAYYDLGAIDNDTICHVDIQIGCDAGLECISGEKWMSDESKKMLERAYDVFGREIEKKE